MCVYKIIPDDDISISKKCMKREVFKKNMAGEEAGFTSRVLQGVCNLGYFVSKLLQLLSFFLSLPRMGENSSHEQNEILKILIQLIRITIKNLTTLVYENELISFF